MAINVGSVAVSVVPDASRFDALLREKLRNLTATIRLDIDTASVNARLDEVRARLARLGTDSPTIRIDVNTASVLAQLAAIRSAAGQASDATSQAGQSASGAGGGMLSLSQAAVGLSPALVGVAAGATGVAAALLSLAAAGAAGFGVFSIAMAGVTGAVKLLGQQQTAQAAAAVSASNGAAAHAQAVQAAARQIATAQQSVASAQYGLIQADQQEQSALQALQSAREAATRQLTSMANAAVDAKLSERQAALDLETATTNYRNTMASSTATEQQRQQATLDLAKAQQHLTESHQAAANAQVDNEKAQKLGVDGAPQVVSAVQAVAAARHQEEQAVLAVKNAQQGVTVAMQAMATAQRNSAGSTNAQLSAINAQVAALDPTTRRFAEYLRGTWGPIWKQVQGASAGGLLPGLHDGMEAMRSSMPGLIAFIRDLSDRMGDMARNVGAAFNSPFWQSFFAFLQRTIGPSLSALGTILGNIATGFAGLWMAFEPVIKPITDGIVGITGKFADFGKQATGSEGFGKFIAFIQATGPIVMKILGDLWQIIVNVVEALAPLAGPMLAGISFLMDLLKKIPVPWLTAAAVAIGAIFAGMKLVQGISALAALGPWGLAALAVAAAFILVYANSKTFRDFIANEVIPTLKAWGDWLMKHLVPALSALWDWIVHKLVPVMAGIFMDAWNGLVSAVRWVSSVVKDNRGELAQLGDAFSKVGGFIVTYVLPLLGVALKAAFETVGKAVGAYIWTISRLIDAWNWMWDTGKKLGHWFANDFVGFFETAWTKISDGWDGLVHGIAKLWNNLKHYMMDPVAFVVQYVINDGLIKAWDWVVDKMHLPGGWHADPIKPIPTVPPLMARGGVLPGYAPGQDTVHAILSPGEGVLVPEAVRALGGGTGINAINSQFSSRVPGPGMHGGSQTFGGGGPVSSILGLLGGATPSGQLAGITAGLGSKDAQRLNAITQDPIGAMKSVVTSAIGGLSDAAPMFGLLKDLVGSLAGGAGQAIKDGLGSALSSIGGNFGAGVPAAQAPSSQAANVATVKSWASPYGWQSGSEWDALVSVINRESGFRNTAQNPTSTAYGMFQFLDSTWAGLGFSKTSDPVLQAMAGMKYISGRYGDPLAALRHEQAFGWYDQGGLLPPGPSLVYNGTGAPELIAPRQTFEQVMSGASGGGSGPASFTGNLYLDSGEFLGKVRGVAQHEVAGALTAIADRGSYNG
jgi:hypothetical protein